MMNTIYIYLVRSLAREVWLVVELVRREEGLYVCLRLSGRHGWEETHRHR